MFRDENKNAEMERLSGNNGSYFSNCKAGRISSGLTWHLKMRKISLVCRRDGDGGIKILYLQGISVCLIYCSACIYSVLISFSFCKCWTKGKHADLRHLDGEYISCLQATLCKHVAI